MNRFLSASPAGAVSQTNPTEVPMTGMQPAASSRSGSATYKGEPYFPWWLDRLADDVTGEGAAIEGALEGPEQVRTLVLDAREIYEDQILSSSATSVRTGSSRSTPVRSAACPPAPLSRCTAMPPVRLEASWSTIGRGAQYSSSPG